MQGDGLIRIRDGTVRTILAETEDVTEALVEVEGRLEKALNYNLLTGPLREGVRVVLNTTALHLQLGTGGYHFVIHAYGNSKGSFRNPTRRKNEGHAMKLRYTPLQLRCLTLEEQGSPYRDRIRRFKSLRGMPVLAGSLHSMLGPAAAGAKSAAPGLRIAYVMTDGGSLPLAFSRLVGQLKGRFIDATITAGQAFGGDYEAVNVYSALIAAKEVVGADVAIVTMGPGKLGTATKYGFSEIEQGEVVNAVNVLKGTAVAIPRICFGRLDYRHYGLSPHTVTALGEVAMSPAVLPFPLLDEARNTYLAEQLAASGLERLHRIVYEDGKPALEALAQEGVELTTMGRELDQDREYFLAAGAAGRWAGRLAAEKAEKVRVAVL